MKLFYFIALCFIILQPLSAINNNCICNGGLGFGPDGGCEPCFSDYVESDGNIPTDGIFTGIIFSIQIQIFYGFEGDFADNDISKRSSDANGEDLIGSGSGNSSSPSVYQPRSFFAFCSFCDIYNDDFVTKKQLVLYKNGSFTNFCPANAEGFFCSNCAPGYYHNLGTRCVECNHRTRDWFLYLLSQFVPITALFTLLFLTNFSLVNGPLIGALSAAQLLITAMDIDQTEIPIGNITNSADTVYTLTGIYKFIYGPTNLEFFAPFADEVCLFEKSSYLYYFSVLYSVALYPLILVGFAAGLHHTIKCLCTGRRITEFTTIKRLKNMFAENELKQTSRNVLASIVFLSYLKFSWLTARLFTPTTLYDYRNENADIVIFLNPYIAIQNGENGALIALAFVCLIFILSLPTLLLFIRHDTVPKKFSYFGAIVEPFQYRFIKKVDEENRAWSRHLKLFKHGHWIPGFHFVIRILLLVAYASCQTMLRLAVNQLICIFAAMFFLFVRPHRNAWSNRLDSFFFLILTLVNTAKMYQFYLASQGRPLSTMTFILHYIMIFIPLVWIASYITHYIYKRMRARFASSCCDQQDGENPIQLTLSSSLHSPTRKQYNSISETEDTP